jgi:hypothetical protein
MRPELLIRGLNIAAAGGRLITDAMTKPWLARRLVIRQGCAEAAWPTQAA